MKISKRTILSFISWRSPLSGDLAGNFKPRLQRPEKDGMRIQAWYRLFMPHGIRGENSRQSLWVKLWPVSLFLFFLTVACKHEQMPPTAASEPKAVLATSRARIELTSEQMELAGIKLGFPEQRVISDYVECSGTVEVPPQNLISVYAPVSGFVQSVSHLPGEYVRKGTLLTTISHPDLVRLQREFLESKSRLKALQLDFERKKTLVDAEAASQRSLEQAQSAFEMEQARYRGLKAELDLIGIRSGELEESGEIQSSLSVRAPVSGFITRVEINTGKLISPQDLLYEIVDNSHIHLELRVYAKDLGRIHEGQRIVASMPGSDKKYEAEVHLLGKMIDPETKTALLHGHFNGDPKSVTPGAYMHAHIYLDEEKITAVPQTAIVREGEKAYLFVEKGTGFEKLPVALGRNDESYIEVLGLQLHEGQRIAISGAYYINGSIEEE